MKTITIPYQNQRTAVDSAIEMSRWCKGLGLVQNKDYDWAFKSQEQEIYFRFYGDNESVSSLFALKWTSREI